MMTHIPPPLPAGNEGVPRSARLVGIVTGILGVFVFSYTFLIMSYASSTYAEGDYAWWHWYLTSGAHFLMMAVLTGVFLALHQAYSCGTRWQRVGKAIPSVALLGASAGLLLFILLVQLLSSGTWR